MKWEIKPGRDHDRRIIHRFLLIPRVINGEGRRLEWAWIEQRLECNYCDGYYWEDVAWRDDLRGGH
jgi:hypothetical protein